MVMVPCCPSPDVFDLQALASSVTSRAASMKRDIFFILHLQLI
jgi:hypothetical protein